MNSLGFTSPDYTHQPIVHYISHTKVEHQVQIWDKMKGNQQIPTMNGPWSNLCSQNMFTALFLSAGTYI